MPTIKPVKVPKLTPKQAKFVKGVNEGKTKVAAAMEAYPNATYQTARVIAAENIAKPSIAQALEAAYERQGITVDAIVRPVADGLLAERTVIIGNGDQAFADQVPDHGVRLKAAGMASYVDGYRQRGCS